MINPKNFDAAAEAEAFITAVANTFNNSNMGERIGLAITQIATEIFKNISEKFTVNDELGQKLGGQFAEFGKNFIQGAGWTGDQMGVGVGTGFSDFLRKAIEAINMKDVSGDFMKQISDAFKEGVIKSDLPGNMKVLAQEFDGGMNIFRENFSKHFNLWTDDTQEILTKIARDTTLKTLPWVALGGALLLGVPLLTMYLYKRVVHDIGRPQLTKEVRKVDFWDRTTDALYDAVSSVWKSAKIGIKWSALAGALGFTLSMVGAAFFETNGYMGQVTLATVGLGIVRTGVDVAINLNSYIKKTGEKDVQPIFNDELQKRIDDLTTATYNIHRNGGYMQNVLLYGPGGTGKTMISKYIAKNSEMNYVMMSGGDLAQYIKRGEHVTELNKLFDDARNSTSPTIVFIDECESLCGDRGKMDRSELIELINCFLNQTGEPSKKVMVILTTNRAEDLDSAVLSRMDHKLFIGLPGKKERKKIMELYLPKFMTSSELNELFTDEMIKNIVKGTKNFTGRTIFKMLNAMSCKRSSTKENKLTEQIITETVGEFVVGLTI